MVFFVLNPKDDKNAFSNDYVFTTFITLKSGKRIYAKDYGLKCADYDLAKFHDEKGVISEDFLKDDETYTSMKSILINYYQIYKTKRNNLTDIISALEYKYRDPKLVGKLMNQIVDIFIFDILLANLDRHAENYGIIENGKDIKVSPVFDNTYMLADLTLMYGGYSLGVDEDDDFFSDDYEPDNKYLMKFLRYSSSEYVDLFKSKMWIISEENIEKILNRVEDKIHAKIDETIRNKIKVNFRINLDNINYVLEEVQERKL